jgi:hypothetical protein
MKTVIFGLTISSSWGNGHATLRRELGRAFAATELMVDSLIERSYGALQEIARHARECVLAEHTISHRAAEREHNVERVWRARGNPLSTVPLNQTRSKDDSMHVEASA